MTTAPWSKRLLAYLIDMHINMIFLVLAYLGSHAAGVNFDTTTALIISIALYVVWYGIGFYNRCIRMGRVGHSWGRGVLGINLVSERSGRPIGVSKALVRENAHIADILILGFGFLLPIWDAKRQTLADKFMHTVTVEGPVPPFRSRAAALAGASSSSTAGVA